MLTTSYEEDFDALLKSEHPELWAFVASIPPSQLILALTDFADGVEATVRETAEAIALELASKPSTPPSADTVAIVLMNDVPLSPRTKSFIESEAQSLMMDGLKGQSLELPFYSKSLRDYSGLAYHDHAAPSHELSGRHSQDSYASSVNIDPSSPITSSHTTRSSIESAQRAALSGFQHILAPARHDADVPESACSAQSFITTESLDAKRISIDQEWAVSLGAPVSGRASSIRSSISSLSSDGSHIGTKKQLVDRFMTLVRRLEELCPKMKFKVPEDIETFTRSILFAGHDARARRGILGGGVYATRVLDSSVQDAASDARLVSAADVRTWYDIVNNHPYFMEFFQKTNMWLKGRIHIAELEEQVRKLRADRAAIEMQHVLRQEHPLLTAMPLPPLLETWTSLPGEKFE
ncbi:hypothetical protein DXG01_002371 [Tephrocybe rancida]|nr:hypothetical protein DXG01_002371 [Tephrocybe rancida]